MKKRSLKSLQLRKNSISNLEYFGVIGGSGTCAYESIIICPEPDTNGTTGCNTNETLCQSFGPGC
jgi:hypothetical protein